MKQEIKQEIRETKRFIPRGFELHTTTVRGFGLLWPGISVAEVYCIGGLQPISRDTDNNAAMYNCWWTNKRT